MPLSAASDTQPSRVASVLQPGYLPYAGFFELMARCDVFVLYDDVQYDKHSWRNRNRILGSNGPMWLTVPVYHKGRMGQLIRDVEINNETPWARKHLAALTQNYSSAPYFTRYIDFFQDIYSRTWTSLSELNMALLVFFQDEFAITTEVIASSSLHAEGAKTDRLVAICEELDADAYISTNGAKPYLETDRFAAKGISCAWQEYTHPQYDQGRPEFTSHLAVVDMLFHCGPDTMDTILSTSRCPFNNSETYRGMVGAGDTT